ncbi:MAG: hypothetical protein ACJ740_02650 [Gaiellales bacterium]|jgi:hypothetical protein
MAINIDTAPSCIQHGVSPVDGTVVPYEKCLDGFFTFGPGGVVNPDSPQTSPFWLGASNGTIILAAIGFVVFIVAMVMWVRVEDGKLSRQAAYLRSAGTVQGPELR